MDELIGNLKTYELKKIDKVAEEPKKEHSLNLKAESKADDEEMAMFVRRFKKFFRKENSEKRESHNKGKSSEKGQFQGCFKSSKMDHLIKDCPLLKEEQRKNSKRQQQLASKAFKKAMKATWGELLMRNQKEKM
ncbi:hypothetical protein HAX54_046753, partial [Datura stramonium]|nr:hypothetical protein [Datura stramonium]